MAKQARKLKRAQERPTAAVEKKTQRKAMKEPVIARPKAASAAQTLNLRALATRLGLPLAGVWVLCGVIAGFSTSTTVIVTMLSIPGVVTLGAAGLVVWAYRQAKKAQGVAGILSEAETAEDREAALERLDASYKKKDPAAVFARAQLLMQEDPDKALAALEEIDLNKVMAPIADQARGQRAMIHLMKGDVAPARALVDAIELSRHQESKERAMLGAVAAEAWARSGQAKKAVETLDLFDPEDDDLADLRAQLYRARVFASAYTSNTKEMKKALRKLQEIDVRLLGGFLLKKTHPLLQKEAKQMLERSGQVPRKMVVQRRM